MKKKYTLRLEFSFESELSVKVFWAMVQAAVGGIVWRNAEITRSSMLMDRAPPDDEQQVEEE